MKHWPGSITILVGLSLSCAPNDPGTDLGRATGEHRPLPRGASPATSATDEARARPPAGRPATPGPPATKRAESLAPSIDKLLAEDDPHAFRIAPAPSPTGTASPDDRIEPPRNRR